MRIITPIAVSLALAGCTTMPINYIPSTVQQHQRRISFRQLVDGFVELLDGFSLLSMLATVTTLREDRMHLRQGLLSRPARLVLPMPILELKFAGAPSDPGYLGTECYV